MADFSTPPRSILVLKPSSLGDVVLTLPAVAALKAHWPESEISWLVNTEWASLLQGNPDLERVIEFPRRDFRGLRGWLGIPRWLASVGRQTPELAMDFQGLLRTALLARFVGSKCIYGLSDAREGAGFFHHQSVAIPRKPIHAADRYLRLVEAVGVPPGKRAVFHLPAGHPPESFLETENYVTVHPFSRGAGKSLEPADVSRLCAELAPQRVVLVGNFAEKIRIPPNTIDLLNRTSLLELIWLIRHARFTVSVDSGPMHIAAALSDRLLSIHTWSDPRLVGPYQPTAWIWKNGDICQMRDWRPSRTENISAPSPSKIAGFVKERVE